MKHWIETYATFACYCMFPCTYANDHECKHVLGGCESQTHLTTPRLANSTLFMKVTFHDQTLRLRVNLDSTMSD